MKTNRWISACVLPVAAATVAQAATLLDIRTMPFGQVMTPGNTGPAQDPLAHQGQWFSDGVSAPYARPYEFHDNVQGSGGGFANHLAIQGVVTSITYGGGANPPIVAFDVAATVVNDLPGFGPWAPGRNSHNEMLNTTIPVGETTLFDACITAEFAVADTANLPALWVPPYTDRQPYIVAANEDAAAWYCWTPGSGMPQDGNYYVPTWNLGDIPLGGTTTITMQFTVPAGLPIGDARYGVIVASNQQGLDIFANRTPALKVDSWIEGLVVDNGPPYSLPDIEYDGSVSVFAMPEPATPAALLIGLAALARRPRRRSTPTDRPAPGRRRRGAG